jgi:predicted glycoside hydrolase/deacetylase ChbG (UPF0249 family)
MLALSWALMLAPVLAQDKNAAEQLGYPATAKLLIVEAADLALSHSVDRASFAALDKRAVSSASFMAAGPWLAEVAAYAKAHPDADLGLDLTLTSEWKRYRWGPVAPKSDVPSLVGPDGNLWPDVALFAKNAKPAEVETEIRAQVERAIKAGIRPSHLTSHMGSLLTPARFAAYVKVAREFGLPFLATRVPTAPTAMLAPLNSTDILPSAIVLASDVKPENWPAYYLGIIRSLKPGITELIVHLGYDNAELQAITEDRPAYGSAWRQRDFNVITSPEFRQAVQDNHVIVVGWNEIKKRGKSSIYRFMDNKSK